MFKEQYTQWSGSQTVMVEYSVQFTCMRCEIGPITVVIICQDDGFIGISEGGPVCQRIQEQLIGLIDALFG